MSVEPDRKDFVRVSRLIDASAARVFDAWLDPRMACRWLFTSAGSEDNNTEIDPRVGGKWRVVDRRGGTDFTAIGEYLEIDRPRRLVFSFGMPQFSAHFSRVVVEIEPDGDGCVLTVTQEGVPAIHAKGIEDGWKKMFDVLETCISREGDFGVAAEPGTVRFERLLPGPIERVWAYLVDSEKRGKWFASGAMEPRAGGAFELRFKHADLSPKQAPIPERMKSIENGHVSQHRVLCFEPPRRLAFTFGGGIAGGESEVTFELTPEGDQVRLVLTHRRLADRAAMAGVSGGWHAHLRVLADRLNHREPAAFWSIWSETDGAYEKRFADR